MIITRKVKTNIICINIININIVFSESFLELAVEMFGTSSLQVDETAQVKLAFSKASFALLRYLII